MNMNLIYRIERIIRKINANDFDQELISSLLVCVREKSTEFVREIGDFIAHPTLKDRRRVYNNIKKMHESLLAAYDDASNNLDGKITIDPPIYIDESLAQLESVLINIHKNLVIDKSENREMQLQSCLLLLLQGSQIKVHGLEGISRVELKIAVNPSGCLCLMAVLPTPLKITGENGQPLYPTEIKY